jgi:hypothetical protein
MAAPLRPMAFQWYLRQRSEGELVGYEFCYNLALQCAHNTLRNQYHIRPCKVAQTGCHIQDIADGRLFNHVFTADMPENHII